MKMYRYMEYLERVDGLIRRRQTGTREDLARRLSISPRTVQRIISDMRDRGIPVKFSKRDLTYYYERPVKIIIEIDKKD